MAFYDNPRFLLSHIRHSFITCDDTGMCEMVMLHEVIPKEVTPLQLSLAAKGQHEPYPSEDQTDSQQMGLNEDIAAILDHWDMGAECDLFEGGQSFDIVSDMELIGAHRPRSNTAQRLERLKKEKKTQAKIKVVRWNEGQNQNPLTDAKMEELFPKKAIRKVAKDKEQTALVSALTEQLKRLPALPNNPFNEYAKFDGKMVESGNKKKVSIFLTMLPEEQRNYPMEVLTVGNAKIQDLVGLICWQYTNEGFEPKLKPNPSKYCLWIAEESGEVDRDFPSLQSKEPVAKFDFPILALVEREGEESSHIVTVHIEDVFSKFEVEDLNTTLREILDQTLKKRKANLLSEDLNYKLEKVGSQGGVLDLNTTLLEAGTSEFNLVVDESSDSEAAESDEWNLAAMTVMEAPLYQSFEATIIHRIGRNSSVQLGISAEKVEINPYTSRGAKFLSRHFKAVTYDVDQIAACDWINYKQHASKGIFKIVYQTGDEFKSHIFQADSQKSLEIVKKMQYILQMRLSPARKAYQVYKEVKQSKKKLTNVPSFSGGK